MIKIDIEKIMDEIRAEAKERHMEDCKVDFREVDGSKNMEQMFNYSELKENLHHANNCWQLPFYFDVGNGIKGAIKKAIRKLLVFIGVPITEHQTSFNAHVVRSFNEIDRFICMQEIKEKELVQRIEELEEKIIELKKNL